MIRLRDMMPEERYDAGNIIREVLANDANAGRISDSSKMMPSSFDNENLKYIGAFDRDLKGFLAFDPETYQIELMYIRPQEQKQGIGRELIQELAAKAQQAGIYRITASVPEKAIAAFASFGFEKTGGNAEKDRIMMEKLLGKEWLGRTVTVTIDRPYGSLHPFYPDTQYPLNYGYVDGMTAGDGAFQDVYVYGPEEALETFTGIVIAIIYRKDDSETKWVAASSRNFNKTDVINAVGFTEQYFETRFLWLE